MKEELKFWSIEYTDMDGDLITTNGVATKAEMDTIMGKFAEFGIRAVAHQISSPIVNSSNDPIKSLFPRLGDSRSVHCE